MPDHINALERIRTIPNDIPKANNALDTFGIDICQDCLERLGIAMDVAYHCCGHERLLLFLCSHPLWTAP